jgi:hypothetical protein
VLGLFIAIDNVFVARLAPEMRRLLTVSVLGTPAVVLSSNTVLALALVMTQAD